MRRQHVFFILLALLVAATAILPTFAIGEEVSEIPPAQIANDDGGPQVIRGTVSYTNPFFTAGISDPVVILEDQTGFVTRDRGYLFPVESQVLGQITSDFFTSPFSYSLTLPIEPQAPLNDVDYDGQDDSGIMIFQVAYWSNTFGDAYLEERDLFGGGWSGSYASARVSSDADTRGEFIGGKILIYASEAGQSFPSGFGTDDMLFTADDPLVIVPQGYTVVDMDSEPFTFDRSANITIDLIESEGSEVTDFSEMPYTEAFDAMIEKFRTEYAFTEFKNLDWDALSAQFRPHVAEAEASDDPDAFARSLLDFTWQIPDGHVSMSFTQTTFDQFVFETDGGLGLAIRQVDDGRVVVNFLLENGPAQAAGIQLGAEVVSLNGVPINEAIDNAQAWSGPFSTEHVRGLQQMRYAVRWPVGETVEVVYRNPDSIQPQTANLTTVAERESFAFSSFNEGVSGVELPVEFEILPSGYMYVQISGFLDDARLTVQLWERMLTEANENDIPGIIIDMRQNGGGRGFLADQMAAYFFDESFELGNSGSYDEDLGEFYFDPDIRERFFLPPEQLRYRGEVAVLVGPACFSACEFFSYDMTIDNRAAIVGQYPTGGLGGGVEQFFMPDGIRMQMTVSRAVDADGNIHIEGQGVAPTVEVPVTEATLFTDEDVVLQAAVDHLNSVLGLGGQ